MHVVISKNKRGMLLAKFAGHTAILPQLCGLLPLGHYSITTTPPSSGRPYFTLDLNWDISRPNDMAPYTLRAPQGATTIRTHLCLCKQFLRALTGTTMPPLNIYVMKLPRTHKLI